MARLEEKDGKRQPFTVSLQNVAATDCPNT